GGGGGGGFGVLAGQPKRLFVLFQLLFIHLHLLLINLVPFLEKRISKNIHAVCIHLKLTARSVSLISFHRFAASSVTSFGVALGMYWRHVCLAVCMYKKYAVRGLFGALGSLGLRFFFSGFASSSLCWGAARAEKSAWATML